MSQRKPPRSRQVGARRDPATTTRFDAMPPGFAILNADPNKHYVWAHRAETTSGEVRFLSLGYEIETYTEDGVTTIGRRGALGDPIVSGAHVLMSIAKDKRAKIEAEGDGVGHGSIGWSDRWEKAMVTESGFEDTLRGQDGRVYLRQRDIRREPGQGAPAPYGEIVEDEEYVDG